MASKVKSTERIRLSGGQVMTLGEALDAGFLALKETTSYSRTKEDSRGRALATTHYIAKEKGGDGGFWEIGKTLYESRSGLAVSAASGSKLEPNPKSDWARTGLADLHRQGFMKSAFATPKKPKAPPKPAAGCELCQDWHQPGKHRYVVWAVTGDVPLGEGKPFADLKSAKQAAEIRAGSTGTDQAVSLGYDPGHPKFKIVARFQGSTFARNGH